MSTATTEPASTLEVLTPTPRRSLLRSRVWIAAAIFVLLLIVITIAAGGRATPGDPYSSTNAAPEGSMAIAEVLRQQGVTVTAAATLVEAKKLITDPANSTIFIYDPTGYLDRQQLKDAVGLAHHAVLLAPDFTQLQAVAPNVAQAGVVSGTLKADCDVSSVQKAGTVSGGGVGYRIVQGGASGCLASGDKVFSLVQLDSGGLTILGTKDALTNQYVADNGNAALALNLLGQDKNLVWYLPSYADIPTSSGGGSGGSGGGTGSGSGGSGGGIAALTPGWVIPIALLFVLVFIAAAVWHGRRMGPLVIENLPVTVRASETMIGRARLYERSSSRLRALDALRIGSIGRLARLCGLPRAATVDEVVDRVSRLTGADHSGIRRLLVDEIPATDRDLVKLSDDLLILERNVTLAVRSA